MSRECDNLGRNFPFGKPSVREIALESARRQGKESNGKAHEDRRRLSRLLPMAETFLALAIQSPSPPAELSNLDLQ